MVKVKAKHRKKYVILPVSLLVFNVLHEVIVYKAENTGNPYVQTVTLMVMFLFGFAFVGFVVSPFVERVAEHIYVTGQKGFGLVGEILIIAAFFVALFYLYMMVYTTPDGVETILPGSWHNNGPSFIDQLAKFLKLMK